MLKVLLFIIPMIVISPLTLAYAKEHVGNDDLIPMQRIIYSNSKSNSPNNKSTMQLNIPGQTTLSTQAKIENTNINPKELSKITSEIKKSVCKVIQNGQVRFWVEASGKAGVIISATMKAGIEITINCK